MHQFPIPKIDRRYVRVDLWDGPPVIGTPGNIDTSTDSLFGYYLVDPIPTRCWADGLHTDTGFNVDPLGLCHRHQVEILPKYGTPSNNARAAAIEAAITKAA